MPPKVKGDGYVAQLACMLFRRLTAKEWSELALVPMSWVNEYKVEAGMFERCAAEAYSTSVAKKEVGLLLEKLNRNIILAQGSPPKASVTEDFSSYNPKDISPLNLDAIKNHKSVVVWHVSLAAFDSISRARLDATIHPNHVLDCTDPTLLTDLEACRVKVSSLPTVQFRFSGATYYFCNSSIENHFIQTNSQTRSVRWLRRSEKAGPLLKQEACRKQNVNYMGFVRRSLLDQWKTSSQLDTTLLDNYIYERSYGYLKFKSWNPMVYPEQHELFELRRSQMSNKSEELYFVWVEQGVSYLQLLDIRNAPNQDMTIKLMMDHAFIPNILDTSRVAVVRVLIGNSVEIDSWSNIYAPEMLAHDSIVCSKDGHLIIMRNSQIEVIAVVDVEKVV